MFFKIEIIFFFTCSIRLSTVMPTWFFIMTYTSEVQPAMYQILNARHNSRVHKLHASCFFWRKISIIGQP